MQRSTRPLVAKNETQGQVAAGFVRASMECSLDQRPGIRFLALFLLVSAQAAGDEPRDARGPALRAAGTSTSAGKPKS